MDAGVKVFRVDNPHTKPIAFWEWLIAEVHARDRGVQLLQQRDAVADLAAVRRVEEREVLDVAEAERLHLQDHGREARAQDLGLGERGRSS